MSLVALYHYQVVCLSLKYLEGTLELRLKTVAGGEEERRNRAVHLCCNKPFLCIRDLLGCQQEGVGQKKNNNGIFAIYQLNLGRKK